MRALTQRMIGFTKYYPIYEGERGGGKKAAIEAGFSAKSASRTACDLLKRPEIQERIKEEKKILADKVEIKSWEIIKRYQDMARRKGDYSDATVTESERGLKQLGKYKNMQGFAEKVIIEHTAPFQDWTVEERDKFIETGEIPKGKKLPDLESISALISRGISKKSGESIN